MCEEGCSRLLPISLAADCPATAPHPLDPEQKLGIAGGALKGYGCQGLSIVAAGMATVELVSRWGAGEGSWSMAAVVVGASMAAVELARLLL